MSLLSPSIYRWQRDVELCWNSASKPEISSFFLGDFDNLLNFVFVKCPRDMSRVGISLPPASRFPSSFPLFFVSLLSFADSLTKCQSCGLVLHRAFLSSCLKSPPPHTHTVAFPKCSEDCSRIRSAVCPQISSGL